MTLDEYLAKTGSTRFRRTKQEIAEGLSAEQAFEKRQISDMLEDPEDSGAVATTPKPTTVAEVVNEIKKDAVKTVRGVDGTITFKINPTKEVSADFFEHLPAKPVNIDLDQAGYGWIHELISGKYSGDYAAFFKDLVIEGLGVVLDSYYKTKKTA